MNFEISKGARIDMNKFHYSKIILMCIFILPFQTSKFSCPPHYRSTNFALGCCTVGKDVLTDKSGLLEYDIFSGALGYVIRH